MISAEYPPLSMASRALAMHVANVSTSLRQGITIETSTAAGASCDGDEWRCATFMALEPNAGCRPRLAVALEIEINAKWSPRPDLFRPSPTHATFQAPPSVAEERRWPAEGTSVPTAKKK